MKTQIQRLPPHQNAKVCNLLVGVVAACFILPFSIIFLIAAPSDAREIALLPVFVGLPFAYAAIRHLATAVACATYNAAFRHIGGLEGEVREPSA